MTKTCGELESEVSEAKDKLDELNKKLTDVDRQLGEAKVDKHETSRYGFEVVRIYASSQPHRCF